MDKYKNDFINYIENIRNYSKYTIKSYEEDLELFYEYCKKNNKTNIKDLDYHFIRTYLAYLYNNNHSKKTISRKLSALRSFFKYLTAEKIITKDPMNLISNPKLDKKLPKFLYTSSIGWSILIRKVNLGSSCSKPRLNPKWR